MPAWVAGTGLDMGQKRHEPEPIDDDRSPPRDSEEPQGDLSDDEQIARAESEGGMTGPEQER
jgi:hypothetical protein